MRVEEAMEEGPLETEGGTGGPLIRWTPRPCFLRRWILKTRSTPAWRASRRAW
jgi:hypothetical protein